MKIKVSDIKNLVEGKFELVNKSVGVLLHDSGFMRYAKLTSENYYYWWYEVEDFKKANARTITYDWAEMQKTRKFKLLEVLLPYHDPNESAYVVLNNALNIESAAQDGIDISTNRSCLEQVVDMYYKHKNFQ